MILPWPYRRIATEEAFSVPEIYQALREWAAQADPAEPDQDFWDFVFSQDTPGLRRVRRQLLDVDSERLEIMDANGVDVHLLSLTAPGVQTFSAPDAVALARLANDRLAEIIRRVQEVRPGDRHLGVPGRYRAARRTADLRRRLRPLPAASRRARAPG